MTAQQISSVYRRSLSGISMIWGAWLLVMGYWWGSLLLCDIGFVIFATAGAVYLVTRIVHDATVSLLEKDE